MLFSIDLTSDVNAEDVPLYFRINEITKLLSH